MTKMMSRIVMMMANTNINDLNSKEDDGDEGVLTTLMVTVMMALATTIMVTKPGQQNT